jgi:putative spermidine/putrescine transport system permease protein
MGTTATAGAIASRPARRGRWLGWAALMLPSALFLVPFFFAPLAIMLTYSVYRFLPGGRQEPRVHTWTTTGGSSPTPSTGRSLGDTLLMGAAVTALALVLSYPLAYTLARSRSRWKGFLTVIVLIPLMTSVVVRSYGWMILLANNGVVNTLLAALQLPRTQLMFNFTGTIIGLTEVLMPFMVLTLSGVIQQIDPDLEDSGPEPGRELVARLPRRHPAAQPAGIAAGSCSGLRPERERLRDAEADRRRPHQGHGHHRVRPGHGGPELAVRRRLLVHPDRAGARADDPPGPAPRRHARRG